MNPLDQRLADALIEGVVTLVVWRRQLRETWTRFIQRVRELDAGRR